MCFDESKEQPGQAYQCGEAAASKFIPAKPKINLYGEGKTFRTCAYCRVSTDHDAQLSSYELQKEHYRQLAESHPTWDLRAIYADGCVIIALNQQTLGTQGVAPI